MGVFKKKKDPISDRARSLNAEIAALEAKIKRLNQRAKTAPPAKSRSKTSSHADAPPKNEAAPDSEPATPPTPVPVPTPPKATEASPAKPPATPRKAGPVAPEPAPAPVPASRQSIFEPVNQERLKAASEKEPAKANELDVRKYDLSSVFGRMRNQFRGRSAANPKLVSYLAAGSIQGLRPLRYEKRVARNRFILITVIFILIVLGIITMLGPHR